MILTFTRAEGGASASPPQQQQQQQPNVRVVAHERLGQVVRILRNILERYRALQATELLVAAASLMKQVEGEATSSPPLPPPPSRPISAGRVSAGYRLGGNPLISAMRLFSLVLID